MNTFSIIIPTCNRNTSLALCLDRLRPGAQTLQALDYEVIVSDDGKDNEAKTLIEVSHPWAKWVEGPKRGPAANRNHGAMQAKGTWLVFTDDDCLPDADWLMEYKKAIDRYPHCNAFEGAILPDDWELLKKDMAECPVNDKGGCFWSANIMIEKKLFDGIGGFDEQFKIAAQEDQDLHRRVKQLSDVIFINKGIVVHPVRISAFIKSVAKIPNTIMNWYLFNRKYQGTVGTIFLGLKSQVKACSSNIAKARVNSAFINLITFFCLLPVITFNRYIK